MQDIKPIYEDFIWEFIPLSGRTKRYQIFQINNSHLHFLYCELKKWCRSNPTISFKIEREVLIRSIEELDLTFFIVTFYHSQLDSFYFIHNDVNSCNVDGISLVS